MDFAPGSESMAGLKEVYGSAEEFLAYLESQACDCVFCEKRIAWLRDSIASGVNIDPPYVDVSLFS